MTERYLPSEKWNQLLGIRDSYEAPAALWRIMKNKESRENLFRETLELHAYDVSYDWFHEYFQDEHADRKKQKQDYTPNSVGKLLSQLVGSGSPTLDVAAGTGGLTIQKWQNDRMQHTPFDYRPSMYLYQAEELSSRSIPFLLFNTAIRGMNAIVIQCDTLTREAWGAWFVQNDRDDHLGFSGIYTLPMNDRTKEELFIYKWNEKAVHAPVDVVGEWPEHF